MLAFRNDEPQVLLDSFSFFSSKAKHYLHIRNNEDYEKTLALIEYLFEYVRDDEDDPINDMITLLAKAVERYESALPDMVAWQNKVDTLDQGVSMLRTIMDQGNLTGSDFENEIGKKANVSMILQGKRNLTKDHIEKLSARFGVSPAMFFNA